jgi:hypothetical protein
MNSTQPKTVPDVDVNHFETEYDEFDPYGGIRDLNIVVPGAEDEESENEPEVRRKLSSR